MNELNRYSNALRQTHSGAHQSASLLACAADPNFESLPLSRGKCVFIVLGWWELDVECTSIFLVLLSENTLQIPAEWNILYLSSFNLRLWQGRAGGKRTDWRDLSVFVHLSNLIALLGFFHPRKSIEHYFCAK